MLLTRETFELMDRALAEDLIAEDVTTDILTPPDQQGEAMLLAKAEGVLAGLPVACAVFTRVDPSLQVEALVEEGSPLRQGQHLARIQGAVGTIMRAERTALNFLQRMSGIATETARYVKAVEGLPVQILDTRKTLPGHRYLDRYAVRMGGGSNHRFTLADGILIKDNHIAALHAQGLRPYRCGAQGRGAGPHCAESRGGGGIRGGSQGSPGGRRPYHSPGQHGPGGDVPGGRAGQGACPH